MNQEESLSIIDFFNILKKRKKIIIGITFLVTLISVIINFYVISPIYEAKTTVIIGKKEEKTGEYQFDYNDGAIYQTLTKTYEEISELDSVANRTIEMLRGKVNLTTGDVKQRVKVTSKEGTHILNVIVQGKEPKETVYVINAFVSSFIEESNTLIPNVRIQVMDRVMIPKEPIKPNRVINIIISFFIGCISSVTIAFIIEYLDDTIKTEKDVEKYLGLSVMAIIPKDFK